MDQDGKKRAAAEAALEYLRPQLESDTIVGIGTGSTSAHFIDALAPLRGSIGGTVASSEASAERLRAQRIPVYELDSVDGVAYYVDGADEVNAELQLIKGGGGALTREKILAAAAEEFICIADDSKWVRTLGGFPLPLEVIPMARGLVARAVVAMGGTPVLREGARTDNGNIIIDIYEFPVPQPLAMEERLNNITGVVCNGIFAQRPADRVFLAGEQGVQEHRNAAL